MTLRVVPGRPDLGTVLDSPPPAPADSPLTIAFLGVTTILVNDGESAVLFDGFFSRPSLPRIVLGRLRSHRRRVVTALARAAIIRLDGVIVTHTHYDHALDAALITELTGARLIGGTSAAHVARGAGLPRAQIATVEAGAHLQVGQYTLDFIESEHSHPDRMPGAITDNLAQPARVRDYRCGTAWSVILTHLPTGRTALIHSSAGFYPDMLDGFHADVALLAVAQLGQTSTEHIEQYWHYTVDAVRAHTVLATHWDDLFRPLHVPLRALPYLVDDVGRTVRVLNTMTGSNGVELLLPTLWTRTDPWATHRPRRPTPLSDGGSVSATAAPPTVVPRDDLPR